MQTSDFMEYKLVCTKCGAEYDRKSPAFRCVKCASILEVEYYYDGFRLPKGFRRRKPSQKKYVPLLPLSRLSATMGEGGSELVAADGLRRIIGQSVRLYLKVETENPTHTFKDRGSAVEISKAMELGYREICCASTGNMGLSLAKYARAHRIKCTVFISKDGNPKKIAKIRAQRARLVKVDGDFNDALLQAERFATRRGAFLCGDYHYRKEGQKCVVYEIMEQVGRRAPDYIFVQVGNATLLAAVYKGLVEFKKFGLIGKMPRLVAVQSDQCAPLVTAYKASRQVRYVRPATAADAIAVGFPTFGFEGLEAVKGTNGCAVSVDDSEIYRAMGLLKESMGIGAELGGATGLAGFLKMNAEKPSAFKGRTAVVIVTGNNED